MRTAAINLFGDRRMFAAARPTDGPRASVVPIVTDRLDDAALMAAIAARADRAAFATVFERYAGKVKAHLIARGAAAGIAEELTQEVMLILWRKAALFDAGKGSVATWLYTISRNCLLNHVRREQRQEIDVDEVTVAPAPPTGEDLVLDAERRASLGAAIERLPPEQRDVLFDAYWRGQTLQECATERALALGTVKTRARLALMHLRELLVVRSEK
jgi:RNA polymerase sigma-70 factor, ECF subfamily